LSHEVITVACLHLEVESLRSQLISERRRHVTQIQAMEDSQLSLTTVSVPSNKRPGDLPCRRLAVQRQVIRQLNRQLVCAKVALRTAGLRLDVSSRFAVGCQDLLAMLCRPPPCLSISGGSLGSLEGGESEEEEEVEEQTVFSTKAGRGTAELLGSHLDMMREVLVQSRDLVASQDDQLMCYTTTPETPPRCAATAQEVGFGRGNTMIEGTNGVPTSSTVTTPTTWEEEVTPPPRNGR